MPNQIPWLRGFVRLLFDFRYLICLIVIICIVGTGVYLYIHNNWAFKDVAQVCTGFLLVITLFFTALNYEFTAGKTKNDAKAAREVLTYNIAAEWHKSPLKDYQITSIKSEKKFTTLSGSRYIEDFQRFIEDESNLEYKESIKGLLNYFETISIGAYKGLIDKDFIKEFHRSIFLIYYRDYIDYIELRRQLGNNSAIFINFTNLAREWNPELEADVKKGILKSEIIIKKL